MSNYHGWGRLVVETSHHDGMIQVAFHDDGPGISEEHQRKIFDPFFTTKEDGTGLGLSLAYGIIKEHNGSISVRSTPGQGATLLIELPIVGQLSPSETSALERPETSIRRRVLVVDDAEHSLHLMEEIFRHLGHQVERMSSGRAALEKIAKHDYDLIVTDMRMPQIDGRHLYYQVKTLRPELARRFIFISGDTASEDTRAFLEGVGCPFVMKPFRIADIEASIKQLDRPLSPPRTVTQPSR